MINDLITTNNLDFMFLIETWLEDNCSATVLTETAPPNLNFISVCRTVRRGGGVAALFKDVYQCKQVSFGQYLSFEYLGIVLKGARRILFIIIYRPPKYTPAFVEEFTELLSMISSEFDCFAIAGDLNIHIDQRFSIPVLASPPLCAFLMLLLSLQTFVLIDRKCPAKWTSHDIPP